jgi:CPA2 family monovalent cation:H+ antiporter-2
MAIPLLNDIVIIFGLSVAVLFLCHRLGVPTIVGFLLTGILAGPHGLGLVSGVHEVERLAEIGVVLLLFTIGIEFSLKDLLQIKKSALLGGSLQVVLTLLIAGLIARRTGQAVGVSVFIGFLVSLSSTAIVLSLLRERAEVDSPHGRTTLAILLFQDVIVVPMMLFTPLLAGATGQVVPALLLLVAKGIGIIFLVIVGTKWVVPLILYHVARTRIREIFLLSVVAMCLGVAWLTSSIGLSLALGAFLAGLIISESEYSHQALGNILPFRDVFTSFFFVSIGMLLDVGFLFQQPGRVVLVALSVLALKTVIAGATTVLLGFPLRTAMLVGLALGQVGEFSFILSKTGVEYGLLTGDSYQLFLVVSVLTMATTPFIPALAPRLADSVSRWPLAKRVDASLHPLAGGSGAAKDDGLKDHLIIIGFGVNGRNVARAAQVAGIPYVIIEMNPDTVKTERVRGEPIIYGDAAHEAVLDRAGIEHARVIVVAISDPVATRHITAMTRRLNPTGHIIARTRFLKEMRPLIQLGADEVIPEEFETSVEIFTRVLMKYLVPKDDIERFVTKVRADGYGMFRSLSKRSPSLSEVTLNLADVEVGTFQVGERSGMVGKSLAQIDLRKKYGVSLLAIRRESHILSNPSGDTKLCAHDVLIVLGPADKMAGLSDLLHGEDKGRVMKRET